MRNARDITERKRAEEALRESEERFRRMAENLGEVVFLEDAVSNRIKYVNPAYERVFGLTVTGAYQDSRAWTQILRPQ